MGQELSVPVPTRQPLRNITPALEEKTVSSSLDETSITISKSPYDEALAYYNECKVLEGRPLSAGAVPFERHRRLEDYEKPLVLRMTARDWNKLRNDLELYSKDEAYPRLSFNASTSTLIIQCMPSPIHQSITNVLTEKIVASMKNLPDNLQIQTEVTFEEDFTAFRGQWSNSGKRPDLGFICTDNEENLRWVLEVGFSETHQQLEDDMRLWLEGTSQVLMVTIVKFSETPPYRSPFPIYDDEGKELDPGKVGIPLDRTKIRAAEVILNGPYGPATYQNLVWVGEISEACMEHWVKDVNGNAVRRGQKQDLLQADEVQLDFSDVLPQGYQQIITINLAKFHFRLQRAIQRMAIIRCTKVVHNYQKHSEGQGRDYHSEGQRVTMKSEEE